MIVGRLRFGCANGGRGSRSRKSASCFLLNTVVDGWVFCRFLAIGTDGLRLLLRVGCFGGCAAMFALLLLLAS